MVKGIIDYNRRSGIFQTYTYDVEFFSDIISTVVTVDSAVVTRWISDVMLGQQRRPLIVGLDTEWGHIPAKGSKQPAATLQLCVGSCCLIYQIFLSPLIPSSLADFLSNRNCSFVGVGVKQDLEKLHNEYGIGGDACHVDLRDVAADGYGVKELKNAGLKRLAKLVLGKEMEKPRHVTMSWWDNRRLRLEQVRYACSDAFVSFEMGRVLMNNAAPIQES